MSMWNGKSNAARVDAATESWRRENGKLRAQVDKLTARLAPAGDDDDRIHTALAAYRRRQARDESEGVHDTYAWMRAAVDAAMAEPATEPLFTASMYGTAAAASEARDKHLASVGDQS